MLSIKSTNGFKTKYDIFDTEVKIGSIVKSNWTNTFTISLPDRNLVMQAEKWYRSNRVVLENETEIARVEKKLFTLKPRFFIEYKNRTFVLRPTNFMQTEFALSLGEEGAFIGTIKRSGVFSNTYETDLPASIEIWFQCLLVCIIIEYKLTQAAAS